jgi:transcription elongation factor GreA
MPSDIHYLTSEGAKRLREELDYLSGPSRDALAKRLRAAIQQGDLSENADYTAAKEEQGFLEGRIQELEQILKNAVLIEDLLKSEDVVNIGSHVTIQEGKEPAETYFLVGPKEADPVKGRISYESPIGLALIGHKTGDEVCADAPGGKICIKILKISL